MQCAEFTGFYDRNYCKDKIFFAKQPYNFYDRYNNKYDTVFVKKFYIANNEIRFKYINFGHKTSKIGFLTMLYMKNITKKKKRYKLINLKCIKELKKRLDIKKWGEK